MADSRTRTINKKIVVYAGCGQGHRQAARSLAEFLNCPALDILDFCPSYLARIYSRGYLLLTQKLPFAWKILFKISRNSFVILVTRLFHRLIFNRFVSWLKENRPAAVISTHFFPPSLVPAARGKGMEKIFNLVLITDIGVHPIWLDKGTDVYCVGLDHTRDFLLNMGVRRNRIVVSGMPLRRGFFRENDVSFLKDKFALNNGGKEAVLFFSSDTGKTPFLIDAIESLKDDFFIFVICGKNRWLKEKLLSLGYPCLRLFDFYENIWEIMAVCLCAITKPGGLTVFESLKMNMPLIFTHYIHGQEKYNMDFFQQRGLGFPVGSKEELISKIYYLRDNLSSVKRGFPLTPGDACKSIERLVKDFPEYPVDS